MERADLKNGSPSYRNIEPGASHRAQISGAFLRTRASFGARLDRLSNVHELAA
jgi:hypothetical protein